MYFTKLPNRSAPNRVWNRPARSRHMNTRPRMRAMSGPSGPASRGSAIRPAMTEAVMIESEECGPPTWQVPLRGRAVMKLEMIDAYSPASTPRYAYDGPSGTTASMPTTTDCGIAIKADDSAPENSPPRLGKRALNCAHGLRIARLNPVWLKTRTPELETKALRRRR